MTKPELPTDLIIRDYQKKDYDEIVRLWEVNDMTSKIRADTSETIQKTLELGGKFLVLESKADKKILGTSWMTYDGRRIHLHHFGIHPASQRKGYAKILLDKSLEFVKEKGSQVKLEVHASNFKAIELYKKYGFNLLTGYSVYIVRDISKLL
jgi:ribosomal protein S18 acetylase RimI-like enzyme